MGWDILVLLGQRYDLFTDSLSALYHKEVKGEGWDEHEILYIFATSPGTVDGILVAR
jgi:hypothetical protein